MDTLDRVRVGSCAYNPVVFIIATGPMTPLGNPSAKPTKYHPAVPPVPLGARPRQVGKFTLLKVLYGCSCGVQLFDDIELIPCVYLSLAAKYLLHFDGKQF